MTVGLNGIPLPWVLVRCRRCHQPVALYCEDAGGVVGEWRRRDEGSCACDPPVVLPDGQELARLVKKAQRAGPDHGAPASV